MTFQAFIMMHQLKKVQMKEDGVIWLDEENKQMITVTEANEPDITIDLSKKWASIHPLFEYLQEAGLISNKGRCYYSLTYSGYHYIQSVISSIIAFLFNSVFVPIAVSAFTTIVLFVVERWLV